VPGYEGLYQASDLGRILSFHGKYGIAERLRRARAGTGGYLYLTLSGASGRRTTKVHKIVLEAFVGPCPEGMVARHLNGDPADCRLSNLRYGTPGENRQDQVRHGTARGGAPSPGDRNGNAKLTELQVLEIRHRHAAGELKSALSRAYGISDVSVGHIVRRKTWAHIPAAAPCR